MAIQESIITLSGKLENQVYYHRKGKKFVRKAPGHHRLSENSKKSGIEFGRASTAASLIRQALSFMANHIADNELYNRLNGHFSKVINSCCNKQKGEREVVDGDLALLNGFQLNRYTTSNKICPVEPIVDINPEADISIKLPGFSLQGIITTPPDAGTLVIQLCCCACNFPDKTGLVARADDLQINLSKSVFPGGTVRFPAGAIDNKVLLIAIGLYFLDKHTKPIGDRNFKAGKIIEAALIREGCIVPFEYQEKKIKPVFKQEQKKGVSWEINGE